MGMRRGQNNGWMLDENNQVIAINLGASFCAEHEWGISDLYRTLGIANDEKILGIDRYRVNLKPDTILFDENKKDAVLVVEESYRIQDLSTRKLDDISGELKMYGDEELATAWCDNSFGIRVNKPKNIKKLKRIHKAILENDAAVWLGGGQVFQNAGLVVGIISAIGDESKKHMYDAHVDAHNLKEASDKTGIIEKVQAANRENKSCSYFALRPAWINKGMESKYPVKYWLNPMDQQKYDANWYTVEQLEQWINGEGPVLKDNKVS